MPPKKAPRKKIEQRPTDADPHQSASASDHGSVLPKGRKKKATPTFDAESAASSKQSKIALPGADPTWDADAGPAVRVAGESCSCLKCSAMTIPGPSVPLSVNACEDCYGAMPPFHVLGLGWTTVCGQSNACPDFSQKFDKAKDLSKLAASEKPYPEGSITASRKVSCQVVANFVATPETSMTADETRGKSAADLGIDLSNVTGPFGSQLNDMVITKATPFLTIKMFSLLDVQEQIVNMSAASRSTSDQPSNVWESMSKLFKENLPVPLRGNRLPPTMDYLRDKSDGMIGTPRAELPTPAGGAGPSASAVAVASSSAAAPPVRQQSTIPFLLGPSTPQQTSARYRVGMSNSVSGGRGGGTKKKALVDDDLDGTTLGGSGELELQVQVEWCNVQVNCL